MMRQEMCGLSAPEARKLLVLISKLDMFGAKIRDVSVEMVDEKDGVDDFEETSEPKRRF